MPVSVPNIFKLDKPILTPAILFYFASFCIGLFLSNLEIFAHTIFLDQQHPHSLILVYISSGILGMLLFYQYSFLIKRIRIKLFILVQFSLTLLLYATGYYLEYVLKIDWAVNVGLVFFFPFSILLVAATRRYAGSVFTRAQKGLITQGFNLFFLAGLVVGGLSYLFGGLSQLNLQYASLLTLILFVVFYITLLTLSILHKKNPFLNHRPENFVPVRDTFLLFRTDYTRYLFLFGVLSGMLAILIHYSFMNLASTEFSYLSQVYKFWGFYIVTLVVASYLLDKFVIKKIFFTYNSPYVIILIPVLVFIGAILIVFVKLTLGESFVEGYSFLFVLTIVLKLGYDFCKNTLQIPSLRTLFRTLDIRYRQIIYSRAEGITAMTGILAGGVILFLIQHFYRWSNNLNLLIIATVAIFWFYATYRLIALFKKNIGSTLNARKLASVNNSENSLLEERLRKVLANKETGMVINALKLSAQFQPLTYEKELIRMIPHPTLDVKKYIVDQIALEMLLPYLVELKNLLRTANEEEKKIVQPVVESFERKVAEIDTEQHGIDVRLNSNKIGDKIMAIEFIWAINDERYYPALIAMSKEYETEVKHAAIKTIARIAHPDFSYLLIEFLQNEEYHAYAFEALVKIGEPAIEHLEKLFNTPHVPDMLLNRVVRIYGKIGSTKAINLLIGKFENQSKLVIKQVIQALKEARFQAIQKNAHRLLNVIVKTITPLGQNLLIYELIKHKRGFKILADAFKDEIEENYKELFDLLSLTYNSNIISQVERLIKNNNSSDLSYAMELLDLLIDEEIKPVLFPLMEDISNQERIKQLQFYFPIESANTHDLLLEILTRDFNQLSIYPRACALSLYQNDKNEDIPSELVFSLYHPNILMQETAAYIIEKNRPGYLQTLRNRIEPEVYSAIQKTLRNVIDVQQTLLIDKYRMVKNTNIFSDLPENILIELAKALKIFVFKKGDVIRLTIRQREFNLFFVSEGKIVSEKGIVLKQNSKKTSVYYSKVLISSGINYFEVTQDTKVCAIDQNIIEGLLFDNEQLVGSLLTCIEENSF